MSPEERKRLTWEDATQRFLEVAELGPADRQGPLTTALDTAAWNGFNVLTGASGAHTPCCAPARSRPSEGLRAPSSAGRSSMPRDRSADPATGKIDRGADRKCRQTGTSHCTCQAPACGVRGRPACLAVQASVAGRVVARVTAFSPSAEPCKVGWVTELAEAAAPLEQTAVRNPEGLVCALPLRC